MRYTLTEEDKIVLSELYSDLIKAQLYLIKWSINVFRFLIRTSSLYLISLEEFSLHNIQKNGLGEVLYQRALRFFKIEAPATKNKKSQNRRGVSIRENVKKSISQIKNRIKKGVLSLINRIIKKRKNKKEAINVYIDKFT